MGSTFNICDLQPFFSDGKFFLHFDSNSSLPAGWMRAFLVTCQQISIVQGEDKYKEKDKDEDKDKDRLDASFPSNLSADIKCSVQCSVRKAPP